MTDILVSTIVVNFNAGPGLGACLRAVCRDDPSAQIIVVDNASSDDSLSCLEMPDLSNRVELVRNKSNLGFSRAVNAGARIAAGRALLILNPDCVIHPGAIDTLHRTLRERPGSGVVGGLVVNTDGTEQRGCRRHEPTPRRIVRRMLFPLLAVFGKTDNGIDRNRDPIPDGAMEVDAVSGAFMLVSRSAFEQLGGLDEAYFLHFEDLDFCRRVRDSGLEVLFDPRAMAIHFKSASGGASRTVIARHKRDGLMRYLERYHRSPWLPLIAGLSSVHHRVGCLRGFPGRHATTRSSVDQRNVMEQIECLLRGSDKGWMVVTGATSQVGDFLLPRLCEKEQPVLAITRGPRSGRVDGNIWWVRPEFTAMLAKTGNARVSVWFQLAPIWLFEEFSQAVDVLAPDRVVAISSSSVITKRDSPGTYDRTTVSLLLQGENWTLQLGNRIGANVTVFRPSMIYGNRNNRNVELIRRLIRRLRFFPLVGAGDGKRQPLHADDLAGACCAVVDNPHTFGRLYTLAGGEIIEFREMIHRIFQSESIPPVMPRVPRRLLRGVATVASKMPGLKVITPDMVDRIVQDLVFDNSPAKRDFHFSPRDFDPVNGR